MKIVLTFDGGAAPNPGEKYGSYEVLMDGKLKHIESRLALGHGTNNEAEFEILIAALERIANYLERRGTTKSQVEISMLTDSTIVANRISGRNKKGMNALKASADCQAFLGAVEECVSAKKQAERKMAHLAARCFALLEGFKSFTIEWHPRSANVVKFGH